MKMEQWMSSWWLRCGRDDELLRDVEESCTLMTTHADLFKVRRCKRATMDLEARAE